MRFLLSPRLYIGWSAFVMMALVASYNFDPYVFGFATLGLAWATGLVAIGGLVVICSRSASKGSRLVVAVAVLVACLAVAASIAVLDGFKWA